MLLDEPGCGPAATAAPQVETPAQGTGKDRVWRCRHAEGGGGGNAPARHRGAGLLRQAPQLTGPAVAADEQGGDAAFLGRQLQTPALREVERADLAHHGDEACRAGRLAAQGFLDRPERIGIAPHVEQQQAGWIETGGGKGARIEIAPPRHPQHAAARGRAGPRKAAADQPRDRCRRQARLFKVGTVAGKFMQRSPGKPAARQVPIDGGKAPIQHARPRMRSEIRRRQLFQQGHLPAQRRQPQRLPQRLGDGSLGGPRAGGGEGAVDGFCSGHILFLFSHGAESRGGRTKREHFG